LKAISLWWAAVCVLAPALALADVDPRFAQLRDAAEPLGSLGTFLDKYVGECSGLLAGDGCRENAAAFRKRYDGKKLYLIIGEESATMVAPGPYQPGTGDYIIHVTPFFAGGNYALTHNAPRRTDANGNPVMPLLDVEGTIPEGWNASMFQRLFSMRGVRAQVVFTPSGVWTLPKKGGGKIYGVAARIDGILLTVGRTGEPLGLWLPRKK